jgi:hypothetical protein
MPATAVPHGKEVRWQVRAGLFEAACLPRAHRSAVAVLCLRVGKVPGSRFHKRRRGNTPCRHGPISAIPFNPNLLGGEGPPSRFVLRKNDGK